MPETVIVGPPSLLARCAPPTGATLGATALDGPVSTSAIAATGADAVVAFDPSDEERDAIEGAGLPALLWWGGTPPSPIANAGTKVADHCRAICDSASPPHAAWRSIGLPVADGLYGDPATLDATVAVNFGDGDRDDHRARVALARGQLLISEPLSPSRGLEPGIDYLEAHAPEDVEMLTANAARSPDAFARIRLRGRRKAELFRASTVVDRLVEDLLLELGSASGASGRMPRPR